MKAHTKRKHLLEVGAVLWAKVIVWISGTMPNKKTCVMELQCSLEWPCQPAFVCNYCLIKHAGQLPGPLIHSFTRNVCNLPVKPVLCCLALCKKRLHLKPQQLLQYVIMHIMLMLVWLSITPCFSWGEVRSLSPHKDNLIILKRLWSLVIEFSKGTRVLRDRGGQLLECGELRGAEGGILGKEGSIKLAEPAWHVEFDDWKSLVFLCIWSTFIAWQRHMWGLIVGSYIKAG